MTGQPPVPPPEPSPEEPPPAVEHDPFAVVADAVDGMRDELADLGEQFRHRLLNDRATRRSLDTLQGELAHARRAAEGRIVQPLLYDIVLILERVERQQAVQDDAFAGSVAVELTALLEKYGMVRMPDVLGPFDPSVQEAVGTVVTQDPELSGEIAEVVRPGYWMDERVVRPQEVRVFTIH